VSDIERADNPAQVVIDNVWMVSREYDGLAGAGGVKDVCRQLAEALVSHGGCHVRVVLPCYGFIDPMALGFTAVAFNPNRTVFSVDMSYPEQERMEEVSVWWKSLRGVDVYLLDSPRFSEKTGVYAYTAEDEEHESWQKRGRGHYDYFAMNILLQKATLDLLILLDQRPDIIHCHDGHAATLPAMMRELSGYRHFFCNTGCVVTIHNAGKGYHQEIKDLAFARAVTGLPQSVLDASLLAGSFDPFMAAAGRAEMNTVSENYARELQETSDDARTGWLGHQLLKRGVRLAGITNGINPDDFNPAYPDRLGLAAAFSPGEGDLAGKMCCKEEMLVSCSGRKRWGSVEQSGHLSQSADLPLFTFIGRLTQQKGVDVLLETILLLLAEGVEPFQLLILGSGDPGLESRLQALTTNPDLVGRICFLKGYDVDLAAKVYAAGDFFLIPSLYEPCGLTDYMAQLMGNLPIVHYVGGLVKVMDGITGFVYHKQLSAELASAMQKALFLYSQDPDRIITMQKAAVKRIHDHYSWPDVMEKYLRLYRKALEETGP